MAVTLGSPGLYSPLDMIKTDKKGGSFMPIRIDDELPAKHELELENIFVMGLERADMQDIRPLRIVLLNLMPTKQTTETQILRLLGNTPLQVDRTAPDGDAPVKKHLPGAYAQVLQDV